MNHRIQLFILSIFLIAAANKSNAQQWEHLHAKAIQAYGAGYLEMALGYLEQAKDQAYRDSYVKHPEDYIDALNEIALTYKNFEYFGKAEPLFNEALDLYEKTYKVSRYQSNLALELGELYEYMNQYDKAIALYKECVKNVTKEEGLQYAYCCKHLGDAYCYTNQCALAEPYFKEAIDMYRRLNIKKHSGLAETTNSMAMMYQEMKQYTKAEPLYLESLTLTEKLYNKNHPEYITTMNNLATLYEDMSQYEKAEELYLQCLSRYEHANDLHHPNYGIALFNLANIYEKKQEYDKAEHYYLELIPIELMLVRENFPFMNDREKTEFWEEHQEYFERFNAFALKRLPQNPELAGFIYDNQLATKAILLNSSVKIRKNILQSNDKGLIELFRTWQNNKDTIALYYSLSEEERPQLGIDIIHLQDQTNTIEKELSLHSDLFASYKAEYSLTWKNIKAHLKSDEAAIEIIRFRKFDLKGNPTKEVVYAAVIVTSKMKSPEMVILPHSHELETKYYHYQRNSIMFKMQDKYSYDLYWRPIADKLKILQPDLKKLYLAPDGIYNLINLYTLQNNSNNRYLIDEIELHLVNNTKEILQFKHKFSTRSDAVLFGNPSYNITADLYKSLINANNSQNSSGFHFSNTLSNRNFIPLPGTEKEINGIQNLLLERRWQTTSYLKDKALEENLKSVIDPKILHIATHGFFIESDNEGDESSEAPNPLLRSGIVMAGVNTEKSFTSDDGILTAYEAMNLNLDNTDLVVLSACETGLGEIKNGEGVFGLQRAFRLAGAKVVMMSLWKIDDEVTNEFMNTFYSLLLENSNLRLSFKEAQKKMRDKYKNPYYWGAFVLIGE